MTKGLKGGWKNQRETKKTTEQDGCDWRDRQKLQVKWTNETKKKKKILNGWKSSSLHEEIRFSKRKLVQDRKERSQIILALCALCL